jgi:hypothetical protein
LFGGLRIGMYEPVRMRRLDGFKPSATGISASDPARCTRSTHACTRAAQVRNLYVGKDFKGDPPLHLKIAAGLTTGALGIMVASPTDLVKVCGWKVTQGRV